MVLPWFLQSNCDSGGMLKFIPGGPALSEQAHSVSCGQVTTSSGQIVAGSLLQSNARCSVSVTHCAGLGARKLYKGPAGLCQRCVGRWETLCPRKSRERKRGQRPGPHGLYKLSYRLPEAQGLPAGQHWTKGLTLCPPVLRHAITLQVIKRATVPDTHSHMEGELTSECCLKEMVQAALFRRSLEF